MHVFQGTFLEFMHVFQGTFCSILPLFQGTFGCKDTKYPFKKGKKTAIISFLKGKFFLSLLLFLYFCNIILKIGVPDSRGMLYYEQSRIIKTRKMMKRTTSLFLFHLPYWHNLNPYPVSFKGLPLGESDDFTLFAACN